MRHLKKPSLLQQQLLPSGITERPASSSRGRSTCALFCLTHSGATKEPFAFNLQLTTTFSDATVAVSFGAAAWRGRSLQRSVGTMLLMLKTIRIKPFSTGFCSPHQYSCCYLTTKSKSLKASMLVRW